MSDITAIWKKNTIWYLLSLLTTSLSAFLGIYQSKQYLQPQEFVSFNILTSGVVLINLFVVGWISQCIIRYQHAFPIIFNKKTIIKYTVLFNIIIGIPIFLIWKSILSISSTAIYPIFLMVLNAIYSTILTYNQANNKAKVYMVSEIIRNSFTIVPLFFFPVFNLELDVTNFWIIWISSYLFSLLFLLIITPKSFSPIHDKIDISSILKSDIKPIVKFGTSISLWIFSAFLFLNADKWYVLKANLSAKQIADYIAISDLITRGCTFIFTPIQASAYPLISQSFDKGEFFKVNDFILKIIRIQILIVFAVLISYIPAHKIVFNFFNISATDSTFLVGILLILVHSIWHVSSMFQKISELTNQISKQVIALLISILATYTLLYYVIKPTEQKDVILTISTGFILYLTFSVLIFLKYRNSLIATKNLRE